MMILDTRPFLRKICENPDDDAPRLVFADVLEEIGSYHGLVIQRMVYHPKLFWMALLGWVSLPRLVLNSATRYRTVLDRNSLRQWKKVEQDTFATNIRHLPEQIEVELAGCIQHSGFQQLSVHRGLPASGVAPLDHVMFYAADIFSCYPLRMVWSDDVIPTVAEDGTAGWFVQPGDTNPSRSPGSLPREIFNCLPGGSKMHLRAGLIDPEWRWYSSQRVAEEAAAVAVVWWGRRQAELPSPLDRRDFDQYRFEYQPERFQYTRPPAVPPRDLGRSRP